MHNLMSSITKVGDQFEEVKTMINDPDGPLNQRFTGLENKLDKIEQDKVVLFKNQQCLRDEIGKTNDRVDENDDRMDRLEDNYRKMMARIASLKSTGRTTSLAQRVMDFVAQNNPDQPTRIDRRLVQAFRNAANAQRKYKMSAYMVVKKAKSAGLEIADDCRCYLP